MTSTFRELRSRWSWRPIPGCPGRFVWSTGPSQLAPADVASGGLLVTEHLVPTARDPVIVAPLVDGGLVSYRKPDGTFVHTLNSREGFERKLQELGIDPIDRVRA